MQGLKARAEGIRVAHGRLLIASVVVAIIATSPAREPLLKARDDLEKIHSFVKESEVDWFEKSIRAHPEVSRMRGIERKLSLNRDDPAETTLTLREPLLHIRNTWYTSPPVPSAFLSSDEFLRHRRQGIGSLPETLADFAEFWNSLESSEVWVLHGWLDIVYLDWNSASSRLASVRRSDDDKLALIAPIDTVDQFFGDYLLFDLKKGPPFHLRGLTRVRIGQQPVEWHTIGVRRPSGIERSLLTAFRKQTGRTLPTNDIAIVSMYRKSFGMLNFPYTFEKVTVDLRGSVCEAIGCGQRSGAFEDAFPELADAAEGVESLNTQQLLAVIDKRIQEDRPSAEIFGVEIRPELLSFWGTGVILAGQIFLMLSLASFPRPLQPQSDAREDSLMLLHQHRAAITVWVLSLAAPLVAIATTHVAMPSPMTSIRIFQWGALVTSIVVYAGSVRHALAITRAGGVRDANGTPA